MGVLLHEKAEIVETLGLTETSTEFELYFLLGLSGTILSL